MKKTFAKYLIKRISLIHRESFSDAFIKIYLQNQCWSKTLIIRMKFALNYSITRYCIIRTCLSHYPSRGDERKSALNEIEI